MTVLVLGPTGNVGTHVIDALCATDLNVRAFVRDQEAAAAVLPASVEAVPGTFDDRSAVDRALDGVDAVFLLSPHGPDMATTQLALVHAARKSGARIVKLSGTNSACHPKGPQAGQDHWRVEQALASSGSPYVILRPNAFMQGLLAGVARGAVAARTVTNPIGYAGLSFVDCADIGRSAARVLTSGEYDGRTFVLTGPSAPTYRQIAARIARLLDTPIEVRDVTPEALAEELRRQGASAWHASHLSQMLTLFRAHGSEYVTGDVELLTGRPAGSVDDFLRRHIPLLTAV